MNNYNNYNGGGQRSYNGGQRQYNGGQRSYNGNNRPSYGGGGGYQNQAPKKHSGAKFKSLEEGMMLVSAWNYSKQRGMITMYARPYTGTKKVESKNGKKWLNLFCTVTYKNTGQIVKTSAMLDVDGKRCYVKELGMIATSAGRGGYFGQGGYKMNVR